MRLDKLVGFTDLDEPVVEIESSGVYYIPHWFSRKDLVEFIWWLRGGSKCD